MRMLKSTFSFLYDLLTLIILGIGLLVFGLGEQIVRLSSRMADRQKE